VINGLKLKRSKRRHMYCKDIYISKLVSVVFRGPKPGPTRRSVSFSFRYLRLISMKLMNSNRSIAFRSCIARWGACMAGLLQSGECDQWAAGNSSELRQENTCHLLVLVVCSDFKCSRFLVATRRRWAKKHKISSASVKRASRAWAGICSFFCWFSVLTSRLASQRIGRSTISAPTPLAPLFPCTGLARTKAWLALDRWR